RAGWSRSGSGDGGRRTPPVPRASTRGRRARSAGTDGGVPWPRRQSCANPVTTRPRLGSRPEPAKGGEDGVLSSGSGAHHVGRRPQVVRVTVPPARHRAVV